MTELLPPERQKLQVYDTTLRDGAQKLGVKFTTEGRIRTANAIHRGIPGVIIEGGWPGSNPTHTEFFRRAQDEAFHPDITAFGMTRGAFRQVEHDRVVNALIDSKAPGITFVGKSSLLQVEKTLSVPEKGLIVSGEENLKMIRESVKYAKEQSHVKRVFYDAEHFFDGFNDNREYALQTLYAAAEGGADGVVLCDTNGGTLYDEVSKITQEVVMDPKLLIKYKETHPEADPIERITVGIHAHKDLGLAEANALEAVKAGANHVQVTVNGLGERLGNTDAALMLLLLERKGFIPEIPAETKQGFTALSHTVYEAAGLRPNPDQPLTGENAFHTAAGMHADATAKDRRAYAHIEPRSVGNELRISVNENSGKAAVRMKLETMGTIVTDEQAAQVLKDVKENSAKGYDYTEADASFYLLAKRIIDPIYKSPFAAIDSRSLQGKTDYASTLFGRIKRVLSDQYPWLQHVGMDSERTQTENGSIKRVLITASSGAKTWTTVGVGKTFEEARLEATRESIEYALSRNISKEAQQ